jgi:hypothetical protein
LLKEINTIFFNILVAYNPAKMLNRLISPTLIEEKIRIVNPGENRIPEYLEPYKMPENAKRILDAFEDDKPEDDRRIKRSLSLPYIQELQTRRQKADLKPYNGFKRYRVPIPEEITISRRLAKESHPLYEFIAKPKPLSPADFEKILGDGKMNLKIPMHRTGAIPASEGLTHQSAWTRDMAAVGLGWEAIGDLDNASLVAKCLYKACSTPSQREKINRYLEPLSKEEKRGMWMPSDQDALKWVPHVKFEINDLKELVDNKEPWGMQQLDALGYKLLLIGKLLDAGVIDLKKIDKEFDPEGKSESTLVSLVKMLKNLEFWDNLGDLGAWENLVHKGRLSSVAAALSGIVAIKDFTEKYVNEHDQIPFKLNSENNPSYDLKTFIVDLDEAISKTSEVLKQRISFDRGVHEVQGDRPYDTALAFLLVLSDADKIGLNRKQKLAVLRSVYSLMGETGFKRFNYDPYMGMNWNENKISEFNPKGETSDINQKDYRSAEWSMFDPYLATINYKLFEDSIELNKSEGTAIDFDSFYRADMHIRRSLAAVTPKDYSYQRKLANGDTHKVEVPKGEVQEAWFYSKTDSNHPGIWLPGENYGLNWTKVAMQQALTTGYIVSNKLERFEETQNQLPVSFSKFGYYDPLGQYDV